MKKNQTKDVLKNSVCLITGLNGFIGSNLGGVLLEKGAKVAGITRELLLAPEQLEKWLKDIQPDYIFHLAAYGNHSGQKDLEETFYTNIVKTYILLRSLRNINYKGFLNFSSSSVYGTKDTPMLENMILEPNTFYGATKACGELLSTSIGRIENKPIVNIRPFSVYGEGEAVHRFIPTICRSIINNEEMTVYEEPVHDWIHVEDFISGVFKVVENIDKVKTVNIGTGEQTSNREVLDLLLGEAGVKSTKLFKPAKGGREYDTNKSWVADNSLLRSLGWEQKVSLNEGLDRTFEYYKKMYNKGEKSLGDAMSKSLEMAGGTPFKPIK